MARWWGVPHWASKTGEVVYFAKPARRCWRPAAQAAFTIHHKLTLTSTPGDGVGMALRAGVLAGQAESRGSST